jgi:hypothetical protein
MPRMPAADHALAAGAAVVASHHHHLSVKPQAHHV